LTPIKFTATVPADGTLKLEHLPPGQRVEVVITETAIDPTEGGKYPLWGTPGYYIDPFAPVDLTEGGKYPLRGREPYRYDDPFGPAMDADDWEANQ